MSWLRLDDQFGRHRKVAPLSDRAWRLHVTALLECCANLTDGRIDRALPATWPAAPRGKALAITIGELVLAGLWEPTNDGWVAHDFLHWNPPAEEELAKRQARHAAKVAAGKAGGKKSAESRAKGKQPPSTMPSKTEAGDQAETKQVLPGVPEESGKKSENGPMADSTTTDPGPRVGSEQSRGVTENSASKTPSRNEADAKQKASPVPVPVPVVETTTTGGGGLGRRIPCPQDLKLLPEQRGVLETALVPGWAIDELTTRFVSQSVGRSDGHRTLDAWRASLATAISGGWNNTATRPKKPQPEQTKQTEELPPWL